MTTPFWLWVSVGCAICALFGFSVVRLGARRLGTATWYSEELTQRQLPSSPPVVLAVPVVDPEMRVVGLIAVDDILEQLIPEEWRRRAGAARG